MIVGVAGFETRTEIVFVTGQNVSVGETDILYTVTAEVPGAAEGVTSALMPAVEESPVGGDQL